MLPFVNPEDDFVTQESFDTTLRLLVNRRPFQPFTVAMVNGDRLEIDHPNAIALRDGFAFFASPGGIPVIFDHEGVAEFIGDLAGQSSE